MHSKITVMNLAHASAKEELGVLMLRNHLFNRVLIVPIRICSVANALRSISAHSPRLYVGSPSCSVMCL